MIWLIIGVGSALGAMTRLFITRAFAQFNLFLPTTFYINIIAAFLAGFLLSPIGINTQVARLAIIFLGSFSTLSTFNFEVVEDLTKRKFWVGIFYWIMTYFWGIVMFAIAYYIQH